MAGVRVDNTPPGAALTSPLAAAVVRGHDRGRMRRRPIRAARVSTSVAFQRSPAGAGTWTTFDTDTAAAYHGTLDTTLLTDGLYDLRVLVTDAAGNSPRARPSPACAIDNTAPTVTLGGVAGSSQRAR